MQIKNEYFSDVIGLVFSTLKRLPITDEEARENYLDIVWDYLNFLQRLSSIQLSQHANKQLFEHSEYCTKLIRLANKFKEEGNSVIDDDKVMNFLIKFQNQLRNYLQGADELLRAEEQLYYTHLCYEKQTKADELAGNRVLELRTKLFGKKNTFESIG